ncbi:HMG-Y-related protein [Drosera capensis]
MAASQDIVRPPPPLPSYSEMIYAAIDALGSETGSNKTSISKYIETQYPHLPAGHATLLRHHLTKMKDTGDLIFFKNNYMRPNPNFIRRGRGRPPKPKGPNVPTSPYTHKPKPSEGGLGLGAEGSGRPRGRPRKNPSPGNADGPSVGGVSGVESRRPRGRPRKNQMDPLPVFVTED